MYRSATPSDITLRPLETQSDYAQCVELQMQTWGRDFTEIVPPAMLMIGQKVGGVSAGAFDESDHLVGFVYGISGLREGRLAHWSHMLAVEEHLGGAGLGCRLKLYQRELLLESGIEIAFWTYDPLVARNAHLNLNKLGADVLRYVPDMYGESTGSELHSGLGTDRIVVRWELLRPRVERAVSNKCDDSDVRANGPIVNVDEDGCPHLCEPLGDQVIRIEIPEDVQLVKSRSMELGRMWRDVTRHAFLWYLDRGYSVTSFYRDKETRRCFYVLTT